VGRHSVEIIVKFFHVLGVIALAVAQAEHALLQDRVLAVPESDRDAQALLRVAKAADAVLAPPIGTAGWGVMGEIVPGIAVGAVVLAHGAPLALAYIGPPLAPGLPLRVCVFQAFPFGIDRSRHALIPVSARRPLRPD